MGVIRATIDKKVVNERKYASIAAKSVIVSYKVRTSDAWVGDTRLANPVVPNVQTIISSNGMT